MVRQYLKDSEISLLQSLLDSHRKWAIEQGNAPEAERCDEIRARLQHMYDIPDGDRGYYAASYGASSVSS